MRKKLPATGVSPYRITVEDIEVIPAALCRKLLEVYPYSVVGRRRLDQPSAFSIYRVVPDGVRQPALGCVQPATQTDW